MKKEILFFLIVISILSILCVQFILIEIKFQNTKKENLELLNRSENSGLDEIIKINFDINKDDITRIVIAHSRHYEVVNKVDINKILTTLNGLVLKRCDKNSQELGFMYKLCIYNSNDTELFNVIILSEDCVKIKNVEYKVTNGKIDYNKITDIINTNQEVTNGN